MVLVFQDGFFTSGRFLPHQAGCVCPTMLTQCFCPSLGLQTARHPAAIRQVRREVPSVSPMQHQGRVVVSGPQHFPSPGWSLMAASCGPASSRVHAAISDVLMMSFILLLNMFFQGLGHWLSPEAVSKASLMGLA